MGADFIFKKVAFKSGKEQEVKKRLLKEVDKFVIPELSSDVKIKILNSLEKKYSEELGEFSEFWEEGLYYDFNDDDLPIDVTDEVLTQKQARSYMKDVIKEFFACLDYRDVNYLIHKKDMIYLTGGVSWGDNPTDSFNIFQKFLYLPQKILINGGIIP